MRPVRFFIVSLVATTFAFAGCLTGAAKVTVPDAVAGHDHMESMVPLSDLALDMSGCTEGGGVSLYTMQAEGEPGPTPAFKRADVQDDTGHPLLASYGAPIAPGTPTTGIWHVSFVCDDHKVDGVDKGPLKGGWVGVRILPPAWDDGTVKRQYMVADFSFNDWDLVVRMNDAAVHASRLLDGKVEWVAPNVVHTVLNDEDHGLFQTHAKVKDYKEMDQGVTRFWMLLPVDGMHHHSDAPAGGPVPGAAPAAPTEKVQYRPVSFDLVNTGKDPRHLVVDGTAWLSHTRTDEHGAVPGAAGNVGGLVYTGFDRTIRAGPAPHDVVLNETWIH